MIGFGSSTSINSDIQAWHRQQLPRREAWLDVSDLVASPAVQDAFRGAFQVMLASVQREAQVQASKSFDAERDSFAQEAERTRKAAEVAKEAQALALRSVAEMKALLEAAQANLQRAESRCAELDGRLGATTIALDESRGREALMRVEMDMVRKETDAAIARLEALASGYAKDIERLDGAHKHALTEIEKARADTRQAKEEAAKAAKDANGLKERVGGLSKDLIASAERCGEAQAEARMLREQLAEATARSQQFEAEIKARQESLRAGEKLCAAVREDASRRLGLARAIKDHEVSLEVSGDTLPKMWLAKSGLAITPQFDSVSQLEAFCVQFAAEIASMARQAAEMAASQNDHQRSAAAAGPSKARGKAKT
jgi:hypothetical protein